MSRRVYLDYCATTPIHPDVRQAMSAALEEVYGNPSSLHWAGQAAGKLLEGARAQVAGALGAKPEEIVFTSGATEADNLALLGVLQARGQSNGHLITSAIEHHAVLHAAQALESQGHTVTNLPVDDRGMVDPEGVLQAIRPETALISVMMVNNEIGSLQKTAVIGRIAREHQIPFHVDAVQAIGLYPVDVETLNVDLLALSAHKIYGPKGAGALYVRQGTPIAPIGHGGPQERRLRPGTENVPGIVGLGAAVSLVAAARDAERTRLEGLRQRLISGLAEVLPASKLNIPPEASAPHVLSVCFPGVGGEMLLFLLNQRGIAASMGSACNAEATAPSHVLQALGLKPEEIEGTLRFSLGLGTSVEDIDYLLEVLPQMVASASA